MSKLKETPYIPLFPQWEKRCWFSINNRKSTAYCHWKSWSSSVFTILTPRAAAVSDKSICIVHCHLNLTVLQVSSSMLTNFIYWTKIDQIDRLPACMDMPSTKSFKDTFEQLELSRSRTRGRKDELRRWSGSDVRRAWHRGDTILDQMSKTIF